MFRRDNAQITAMRDNRIDFVRGVALWLVYVDHIGGNALHGYTPISLGLSDMAEVFVFVSGYTAGIVSGTRDSEERALRQLFGGLRRAIRIYCAWVVTLLIIPPLHDLVVDTLLPSESGIHRYDGFWHDPLEAFFSTCLLETNAGNLSILVLYITFMPFAPFIARLARSRPCLLIAVSTAVYISAQCTAESHTPQGEWTAMCQFNPLAWQLLFVIGITIGSSSGCPHEPAGAIAMAAAMAVVGFGVVRGLVPDDERLLFSGKQNLEPMRLLHFAVVAIVGAKILALVNENLTAPLCRPLIQCGRHSLLVFCSSVILADVATVLLEWAAHQACWQLIVNAGGILCLTATAVCCGYAKRCARRMAELSPLD